MSFELVSEKIMLDRKIGTEKTQILLESDLIVPDIKPDVKQVLQADGICKLDKVELTTDKVMLSGMLSLNILYLAGNAEKPVHNMVQAMPLEELLNMDGVIKDMWADVDCELKHLECRVLNERKINVRAIIDVKATVNSDDMHEAVINVKEMPQAQLLKSAMKMNRVVDQKEERIIIKDEFAVSAGKPNIREILNSKIYISNKDVRVGDGKVSIKGDMTICTLYVGDTDDSVVEYIEHETSFNGVVEMRAATEDCFADVVIRMGEQYIQVRPDTDGEDRLLEVEMTISAKVKLNCEQEIHMIEDAYCINKKLNLLKDKVSYPQIICRNRSQSAIKESVVLDDGCPPIMQVYHVTGRPMLDEIRVMEDKVLVEGVIQSDIIYVAESDDMPIYSYNTMIPFKQVIEAKGATPKMLSDIDAEISHSSFNMLSKTEVELRYVVNLNVLVTDKRDIEIVKNINVEDLDKSILDGFASMTMYVVQPCDSLWKIAKKYNTSVEEIAKLNDIENVNKIMPGQKLLILKKTCD